MIRGDIVALLIAAGLREQEAMRWTFSQILFAAVSIMGLIAVAVAFGWL
jgi:hypothetical protein